MATESVLGVMTYPEWAMRMDPTGRIATLVNLQSQCNAVLEDAMAVECQNGNSFEFTQVVSLPTPSRRQYNQGIAATLAGVAKQVQTCVEYADLVKMDDSLARLGGNLAELRAQELKIHLESLGQTVANDMFYANRASDPTQFTGFANIYNTVSTTTSQIANNVIDCGGTQSTNASMWLLGWGPKQIHTIFPKGIPAGMVHEDRGKREAYDTNTPIGTYLAWLDWIQWNMGICVHDWRYGVRAANIDVTTFGTGTAPNLIHTLNAMVMKPPIMPAGVGPVQTSDDPANVVMARSAIYVNRTVYLALDIQAQDKANLLLKMEEWDGHVILTYRGIPIRVVDKLTIAESRVV